MKIIHLRDFNTSDWSGGRTTELFLYPEDGSYAQRNFKFRISSATVDLEESDFTPLPGVERFITPLEGGFTLIHPGQPAVQLPTLAEPYEFSGDVPTHCVGRATDFNLMLKGCRGKMELHQSAAAIVPGFNGFYPIRDVVFTVENQNFFVKRGELLVIFAETAGKITFDGEKALTCWVDI